MEDLIKKLFYESADLKVDQFTWHGDTLYLVYYQSYYNLTFAFKRLTEYESLLSEAISFDADQLKEWVTRGETIAIKPSSNEMIRLGGVQNSVRSTNEPMNEQVVRGTHEGFVEDFSTNIQMIRKKLGNSHLKIEQFQLGSTSQLNGYMLYLVDIAEKEHLNEVRKRIESVNSDYFQAPEQLEEYIEDSKWAMFPQLLNTERPDRVVANLLEGRIAICVGDAPNFLITPISFFSFFQTPDDFNSRILVGSFYRLARFLSLGIAIFLPAFYIAVINYHIEVFPYQLAVQVQSGAKDIPFRALLEALIVEVIIELIREASIRLPSPVGKTIGIVGGLVIGDAIVTAGLVSPLMVIIVALTAIASFVVPSVEMNTSLRLLRFPFMILASMFGFFGIVFGALLLIIHLLQMTSLNKPYLEPLIPFELKKMNHIFVRGPFKRKTVSK